MYAHKEKGLKDAADRHPADRYVAVDDSLRILSAIKDVWKDRVTTIFVRQGHFASGPERLKRYPDADVSIKRIGDLLQYDVPGILQAATRSTSR